MSYKDFRKMVKEFGSNWKKIKEAKETREQFYKDQGYGKKK